MSSAPRRPGITSLRKLPLIGVVSVLLLIVALLLEGTPPTADAGTDEVVAYYAGKEARLLVGTVFAGLAAAALLWFGGIMHTTFRAAEGKTGQVSAIAFGGFGLASAGHAILFGFVLAGAETVGDVPPEVTQTLGVLAALLPTAVGMFVALLASAVAILRRGAPAALARSRHDRDHGRGDSSNLVRRLRRRHGVDPGRHGVDRPHVGCGLPPSFPEHVNPGSSRRPLPGLAIPPRRR